MIFRFLSDLFTARQEDCILELIPRNEILVNV